MTKKDITNILKECFWEYNFSEDDIIAFKSKDDRLKTKDNIFAKTAGIISSQNIDPIKWQNNIRSE